MLVEIAVQLRNVAGTQAALGWAGGHTVVADRLPGKAGGLGLGFNGGELLALALGGCFCNDLRYVAEALGVEIGEIYVAVALELDGDPLVATAARMEVKCTMRDGSDAQPVVEKAKATCMVSNSMRRGIPVTIQQAR